MRIALDAHYIGTNCGGIETYTYNLIDSLLKMDKVNRYSLFLNPLLKDKFLFADIKANLDIKYLVSGKGPSRIFIDIPFKLLKYHPDIYHGQIFLPVCVSHVKRIITLHDVFFLENKWLTLKEKIKFKYIYYSTKNADHIITVSNFSKNEILKNFKIPEKNISVIYYGISDCFFERAKDESIPANIKAKYALPEKYVLYAGRLNARKNLPNLIMAFHVFKKIVNPYKLVIAGKFDGKCENINRLIRKLNMEKDIIFLGHIGHDELPYIYSSADLFLYLSFYEGFGLPPLEAMASKVPVIASNIPVFHEILGDAAILVNPYNPYEISSTMHIVIKDGNLKSDMIEKGLARAKNFSWQKCAYKTLEIYNKI